MRCLARLTSLCLLLAPAISAHAERQIIHVLGDGSCPSASEVASALRPLLPSLEVSTEPPSAADVVVARVWNRSSSYGVAVASTSRDFDDANIGCADRASAVALVIALAVAPPSVPLPPPPEPEPEPEPAPIPESPAPPATLTTGTSPTRSWRVSLDLGTIIDTAPGVQGPNGTLAYGGSLRLAVGLPWVQALVGFGALSSSATEGFESETLRMLHLPVDLGVRFAREWGRFTLSGDLGVALDILRVSGGGLRGPRDSVHADLGVRLAANFSFRITDRWSAFLSPQAVFLPSPFAPAAIGPREPSPSFPWLHMAVVLGASVRFD
jgi:hypothetical protein